MPSPFRFGVQLSEATTRSDWVDRARRAEELGYSTVCLPDHMGSQLAPFPALVSIAEATDSVRVGTFVVDNDFRHPLMLAHEAATVDLLTDGRLELGIGAGWLGQDYERLGMEFAAPKVRLGRLKEAIEIIDLFFRGEPFSFAGSHYRVVDVEPYPKLGRRPPLLIGGGGPLILGFAARRADIVSVMLRSKTDGSGLDMGELNTVSFDCKIARIREAAGDRAGGPELNVLLQACKVTDDREGVAAEHARELGIELAELLALPFELIGTIDEMADDLFLRRDRYGFSYITVFERHMEAFAPLIERLAGT